MKTTNYLLRKSLDNEFCRIIGIPLFFTSSAPILMGIAVAICAVCGLAGWLEGLM